ncbi:MAG: hypothetical protein WC668_00915 [Patescibacteria group bacterium]
MLKQTLNPDIKIGCYYFQIAANARTGNILWVTAINQLRGLYVCDILNVHDYKVYTDKMVPPENIDPSCTVPTEAKKIIKERIRQSLERRLAGIEKFFKQ